MCFHNSLSKTIDQLANRYKRKNTTETSSLESIEDQYHLNAFTNPLYPIITKEEEAWLSPHITKEKIKDLLSPLDAKKMDAYMIDSNILKKDSKDESIINKINLI